MFDASGLFLSIDSNIFFEDILSPEKKIDDFNVFFEVVQERTGFFKYEKGGIKTPYKLFKKQKSWIRLFDNDLPQRRALLASRDKGKSEIVTILGSAWMIYCELSTKIAVMSFKYENAEKMVNQIVAILDSVGVRLRHKSGGWYTRKSDAHTPNLIPFGLMSTARGMHFDYLILDDPLTINEQFSKKYIDRSRYFLNEGASIAKKIILIGQLLTRNDIYYDAYGDSTGKYHLVQSWHGDIPELDKDIDYLRETIGTKDLARNYLGYIEDEAEAIFRRIKFETVEPSGEIYAFIDPSSKGKDFTALAIGWFYSSRLIIKGILYKAHWGDCLEELATACKSCFLVYYEDNHGRALGRFLADKGLAVQPVTTSSNKIAKIYSMKGLINCDRIRLCNTMDDKAVEQVQNWTETAEHDDLPDAISMLVQKIGVLY